MYLDHCLGERHNVKDHLGSDVVLFPLFVGPAIAFRSAKDEHSIRATADVGPSLYRLPRQAARDKNVGIIREQRIQSSLNDNK